ncbi:MAG TPA: succinyl-diaminopimelate desuccinylase [Candidatus Acidoferrales bacterium]|nr:succinyl-diaminopimelate desuccinylase [Candidatus Acidoferrales bacterium]
MTATAESIADLLVTLVDTPSVTGNERAIAELVAARLAGGGEVLRSGHGVVWRGPRRGRPLVVLAGHTDTVPPQGNARARIADGSVHGLGTSDMKAGDAVMLALHETLDFERLRFDVAIVFYDAEEGPAKANGLGRILSEMPWLAEASLAVLLEPTDLQVEMGCNGILNVEVRVPGVPAHAARPWMGRNAVAEGAPWLGEITRFPVTPVRVEGLEYRETLQVTTLHAGGARNVVPGEMVANLNHRFPPDRSIEQAVARVRALVPEAFGFEVVDQAPPGKVCLDHPEVQAFVKRFGATVAGKQGWTDVARFTSAGVPAFNFGPGLAELCHRADERCPIANLGVAYHQLAAWLGAST